MYTTVMSILCCTRLYGLICWFKMVVPSPHLKEASLSHPTPRLFRYSPGEGVEHRQLDTKENLGLI